ncbi:hypothetical protein IB286_08330 [Spongiibacter sp. KMU-158]|uniref:Flagellar motor switch protein FliG n=1 Tax=Spongiibacter pelagi TaxID=2760804 RepID=A0A927C3M6_9GAMM|nr:FliG C-terminal domain-containing protein [Spongiibacter pelagi]MBD2859016.1 hypothetical protein [Spongiibacter pelagi]
MISQLDTAAPMARFRQLVQDKPERVALELHQWFQEGVVGAKAMMAAALFMALDGSLAKPLLRYLEPVDIKLLIKLEAQANEYSDEDLARAALSFVAALMGSDKVKKPSNKLDIRALVNAEFGEEASQLLAMNLDLHHSSRQIDKLRWLDPEVVLQLIADEHPQVQAALLACLPVEQARALIPLFDSELAEELMLRLSAMSGLSPLAVAELDYLLEHKLERIEGHIHRAFSGEQRVTAMLKGMKPGTESQLLSGIQQYHPKTAERIQDALLDFDQIAKLPQMQLGRLLGWFGDEALSALLSSMKQPARGHFMAALPESRRGSVAAGIDTGMAVSNQTATAHEPRTTLQDADSVKQELVGMAKKLAEAGELVLGVEPIS